MSWNQKGRVTQQIADALIAWGKTNYRDYPWRRTSNRFHAIIAEIMLQRTKAEQVLAVYNYFTQKYGSPDDVCSDSIENVNAILKPLGLRWRAKGILDFSATVRERGSIPGSFEELTKLPSIGQYVASAFLSLHDNQCFSLIDANTVRVWGRVFGFETDAETRRKKKFKELVDSLTPETNFKDFNYAILDFSSLVCKTVPLCEICLINKMCCYYEVTKEFNVQSNREKQANSV